jgi:hypothetical protein
MIHAANSRAAIQEVGKLRKYTQRFVDWPMEPDELPDGEAEFAY